MQIFAGQVPEWLMYTLIYAQNQVEKIDDDTINNLPTTDDLMKTLKDMDLDGVYSLGVYASRSMGFGPEYDFVVTTVIGLFVFMIVVGYLANPSVTSTSDNKSTTDDTKQ